MNTVDSPNFRFEAALQREAEHVLEDLVFLRSPVQSRLLRYLVDREMANLPAPTQYEIAVDGLGREPDYDIQSDSYPRVQISRLRKNLDDYYARNQPMDGMRIALEATSYRLKLVPEGTFTAQRVKRTAQAALPKAVTSRKGYAAAAAALIALILAVLVITALNSRAPEEVASGVSADAPRVVLRVDARPGLADSDLHEMIAATARQIAEVQLTGSLVSEFAPASSPEGPGWDYELTVDIGEAVIEDSVALVSLRTPDQALVYTGTIPYTKTEPRRFMYEFEAMMIFLTSPNGVIADSERKAITDPFQSDYACFLSIEDRRSGGEDTEALLGDCLTQFPGSEYQAFWLARQALAEFQTDLLEGRRPQKDTAAWRHVERSFEIDRYNTFANFVAAKVELANGRCEAAQTYIELALERGSSYPTLVAAIQSELGGCPEDSAHSPYDFERLSSIARFTPSPDPLFHLHLMTSALSTGNVALARDVADRRRIEEPRTPTQLTANLLRKALIEPGFAEQNRERIGKHLAMFVWNERAVERMLDTLTELPEKSASGSDSISPHLRSSSSAI